MAILFKGFKQVLWQEGLSLENGYVYFVRTDENKQDGYIYFNGKKYGTAQDVKAEILGNISESGLTTFEAVNTAINELGALIEGIEQDFEQSNHSHDNKAVLDGITAEKVAEWDSAEADAIEAAKQYTDSLSANYAPSTAPSVAENNAKAYTDAREVEIKKYADNLGSTVLNTAKEYADGLNTAMDARVDALEGSNHTHDNKAVLDGITAEKVTAWDGAEAAAKAYTDELANGAVKSNTDAIAVLNGTGEGSVDAKIDAAFNEFSTKVSDDSVVNTYKELIDYAATHGAEFTELVGEVDKKADKETVATDIANAEAAAKEYADGLNTAMDARVDALEAIDHSHDNKAVLDGITSAKVTAWDGAEAAAKAYADSLAVNYDEDGAAANAEAAAKEYADGLNNAMDARVDALEAVDHSHDNKAVLDGITSAKVTAWDGAEAAAKEYADGLNNAMDARVDALEAVDHSHDNKDVLDGITSAKVTAWDGAEAAAKEYADGLNDAMDARVDALEAIDHSHDNKAVLDGITSAKVTAWDGAEAAAKAYADGLNTAMDARVSALEANVANWNAAYAALTVDGDDVE